MSFSSISLASISFASAYNAVAASPTTSSLRMRGNLPARSQEMKNGVQSMYSASTFRSMLSSTREPVKVGLTGVAAPVELRLLGDGGRVAQAFGAGTAVGGAFANVDVFQAGFLDETSLQFLGQ